MTRKERTNDAQKARKMYKQRVMGVPAQCNSTPAAALTDPAHF